MRKTVWVCIVNIMTSKYIYFSCICSFTQGRGIYTLNEWRGCWEHEVAQNIQVRFLSVDICLLVDIFHLWLHQLTDYVFICTVIYIVNMICTARARLQLMSKKLSHTICRLLTRWVPKLIHIILKSWSVCLLLFLIIVLNYDLQLHNINVSLCFQITISVILFKINHIFSHLFIVLLITI